MKKFLALLILLLGIFSFTSNVTSYLIGADEIPEPKTIIGIKNA